MVLWVAPDQKMIWKNVPEVKPSEEEAEVHLTEQQQCMRLLHFLADPNFLDSWQPNFSMWLPIEYVAIADICIVLPVSEIQPVGKKSKFCAPLTFLWSGRVHSCKKRKN